MQMVFPHLDQEIWNRITNDRFTFNQSTVSNPILALWENIMQVVLVDYGTACVILNIFGQSGTQVRFGIGGQPSNIAVNYASEH